MEKAVKNPFIEKWVKHKNEQGASIDILHPELVGFFPACGSPYNNTECKSQANFSDDGKHFFSTTLSSFFQ